MFFPVFFLPFGFRVPAISGTRGTHILPTTHTILLRQRVSAQPCVQPGGPPPPSPATTPADEAAAAPPPPAAATCHCNIHCCNTSLSICHLQRAQDNARLIIGGGFSPASAAGPTVSQQNQARKMSPVCDLFHDVYTGGSVRADDCCRAAMPNAACAAETARSAPSAPKTAPRV